MAAGWRRGQIVKLGEIRTVGAQGVATSALLIMLACGASACSRPCADLAQRSCERGGESSPVCLALRAEALNPTADGERRCRSGLRYLDELERK
ncbi:MAG: hypothetical protein EXR77_16470 [Myxococcales bacterium]|nr:hypothetical protein [Myxococcales bacterium]